MTRIFENPSNGYREVINPMTSGLCAIIFGPLYFAIKGVWGLAITEFLISVALIAMHPALILVAFLIQAIIGSLASDMIAKRYLQRGWKEIKEAPVPPSVNAASAPIARACPQCLRVMDQDSVTCNHCAPGRG
ncbi:DUF2628 domain-containing protein [Burkholderia humptydooensis]|uniref:DUF2628 domain-containing protein n=1 Tax=Burkholderia humptydooensis TaxID=430531 RepID=UPI0010FE2FEB|nr:DUF2628 domain-containing protein [Burkholderia humptydooensis]